MSYRQALEQTRHATRHLLLGNGFSIALYHRFSYPRLFDVAAQLTPQIIPTFQRLGTTNFEIAMSSASDERERVAIRFALLKAIAKVHPYSARHVLPVEFESAVAFLEPFVGVRRAGRRGVIFTTNYDLLLYWTLVTGNSHLKCYDGFDSEGVWNRYSTHNVAYLHGALHLYEEVLTERHRRIRKLLWEPDQPLINQMRTHLNRGAFPLFVSEGSSAEKMSALRRHEYLRHVRRMLQRACDDENAAAFIVGHGLGESDDHIVQALGGRGLRNVFVGTFGQADTDRANELTDRWTRVRHDKGLAPVIVRTFDVSECFIWKPNGEAQWPI